MQNKGKHPELYIPASDVEKILVSCEKCDPVYGDRNALIVWLMHVHGLTIHEVLRLRWVDIDLVEEWLRPGRTNTKRNTPHTLSDEDVGRLATYHARWLPRYFLFPSLIAGKANLSVAAAQRKVYSAARKIGFEDFKFKSLKYSCGVDLINEEEDPVMIKIWLGHLIDEELDIYIG